MPFRNDLRQRIETAWLVGKGLGARLVRRFVPGGATPRHLHEERIEMILDRGLYDRMHGLRRGEAVAYDPHAAHLAGYRRRGGRRGGGRLQRGSRRDGSGRILSV